MKVILLKDVPKVGLRNDIRQVKDGYALNLLIPRKLAIHASPQALKNLENIKARETEKVKVNLENLEKELKKIGDIKIKVKANEKGHLFAGIGKEEIREASGIPEENIVLKTPLKEVGEHEIEIKVGEKSKKVKVILEKE